MLAYIVKSLNRPYKGAISVFIAELARNTEVGKAIRAHLSRLMPDKDMTTATLIRDDIDKWALEVRSGSAEYGVITLAYKVSVTVSPILNAKMRGD